MRKFASLPLVALCRPEFVGQRERSVELDFENHLPLLAEVLECLQPYLANRWIEVEESKTQITHPEHMQRLGTIQASVLKPFLKAADHHGRRDLARFLLIAFQRLIPSDATPEQLARHWIKSCASGTCDWPSELLRTNRRLVF